MQHPDDTVSIVLSDSTDSHSTNNEEETTCSANYRTCWEDYSHTMVAYTQRQISSLVEHDQNHGSSSNASPSTSTSTNSRSNISSGNGVKSDVSADSVLYQGPGLPEADEIEGQTANIAGCSQV